MSKCHGRQFEISERQEMIEKYKIFAAAGTTAFVTMSTGLGFAIRFLYDARDYPELQLLLLSIVALVIGTMTGAGGLGLAGFILNAMSDHENKNKPEGWRQHTLFWTLRTLTILLAILLLAISIYAFFTVSELLRDRLAGLTTEIEARIPSKAD